MRKAFDNVNHECLWNKLHKYGIDGRMFKAIQSLYKDVSCSVRVNGRLSPWFGVSQGVKQGCTLSPTLFQIYINDLIDEINALECGINIGNKSVSVLLFADDIAIIAKNEEDLQRCLNVVNNWCNKWRLSINSSKSKIIHYRFKGKQCSNYKFMCGQYQLDYTDNYRYLGLWLNEHLNYDDMVKDLSKSASRALSALIAKYYHLGGMEFEVYTKLYMSLVVPVFTYGAAI